MKRAAEPDPDDADFVAQVDRVQLRELKIRRMDPKTRPVFVVLEEPDSGLYSTFDQVIRVGGRKAGHVYKQFRNYTDAVEWYRRGTNVPQYMKPNLIVHVSGRNYDVTRDKDWFSAVGYYISGQRAVAVQASRGFGSTELTYHLLMHVLNKIDPSATKVRLVIDCPEIAYGLKYGLWHWKMHDIVEPPNEMARAIHNRVVAQKIEVVQKIRGNLARAAVEEMCRKQNLREVPYFQTVLKRAQCKAWLQCAIRMGVNKDIRKKIGALLYSNLYYCRTVPFVDLP